jgi:uncharacterized membrane protein YphA (DoxX/SURF4 family)
MTPKQQNIMIWILRAIPAIIMMQTLFFKFTASDESVYIFSAIGMEPLGRIGSGVVELIASILILIPRTTGWGALLGVGVISGALYFHLSKLGLVVKGDHGQLFIYALIVFLCCLALLYLYRKQIFALAI